MHDGLFTLFFLVFVSAAVLATVALFTRQPLLVAYIAAGLVLGPSGAGLVTDLAALTEMAHIGIVFLLFLLGLDLQPSALRAVAGQAARVALASSAVFAAVGYGLGVAFGFSGLEAAILAMAVMFSSTIIGIKLLPTTVLHHKHIGELMVGLLLLQDFLAIICLLILLNGEAGRVDAGQLLRSLAALPLLIAGAWAAVHWVLFRVLARFDRFREYTFLLAIGWCLGLAVLSEWLGLSAEIGAFVAGILLATHPISQYLALSLKPLRDFFLVLFFFALGAQLDIALLRALWAPALITAAVVMAVKPVTFWALLRRREPARLAWSVGFRLGQISEFSLLIVMLAAERGLLGERAAFVIQAAAIITFVVSSYLVIGNFHTPIASSERLRRD